MIARKTVFRLSNGLRLASPAAEAFSLDLGAFEMLMHLYGQQVIELKGRIRNLKTNQPCTPRTYQRSVLLETLKLATSITKNASKKTQPENKTSYLPQFAICPE